MLKISFSFTDEFNQESILTKTITDHVLDDIPTFDLLVDEFKKFLLASGFSENSVKQLQIVELDEE
jgi:hypothetical protein